MHFGPENPSVFKALLQNCQSTSVPRSVYFLLHIVTKYGTTLYTPPESRRNLGIFINVFKGVCGYGHAPTAGAKLIKINQ
jgi:hypothetical protein